MRSLTGRLIATAVALVAVVSLMVVGLTTYTMSGYLSARLDERVLLTRYGTPPPGGFRGDDDDPRGGPGTLQAALPGTGTQGASGRVDDADRDHSTSALTQADLAALDTVPVDRRVHVVDLPDAGEFHVVSRSATTTTGDQARVVVGLPSSEITQTLASLLTRGLLLAAGGVLLAGAAGFALVRRQLRPLREVAATAHEVSDLPLATGDIDLTTRVPAHLTDERTEVGQVGSALNTLLAHVETSLEQRHRSEQQVRQFVADASHELRTPLATITGYTELARRRPDDETVQETALAKVEAESRADDQRWSRTCCCWPASTPDGRSSASPSTCPGYWSRRVSDARVLAPDHHWRLDLPEQVRRGQRRRAAAAPGGDQPADQRPPLHTRRHHRHGPRQAGRRSRFTTTAPASHPSWSTTAFERFARGDVSRTRAGDGGVGLGLSLVKAIAVAHGGSVRLDSASGETTVTVQLPGLAEATAD